MTTVAWDRRLTRRLKLRDLEILMAVVEAGSMGKAAQQLNLFQPAVSKAIAELEHSLGVRLVDRTQRGIEPTPYGLALTKRGEAVFDELKLGVQEIEYLADPSAGELRIGGSDPMVAGLIPAIIDRISRRHPRVAFRVIHGASDPQMFQALRQRNLDMFITRVLNETIDDDLHLDILFNEPFLVAAGQRNPWSRRRRIELRRLVDEPWVLPRPETMVGSLVANMFRANGCEPPRNAVLCNSMQLNHALLATGRYFAVYSNSFLQLSAKMLGIKVLPVKLQMQSTPAGVVTLKNRTTSPIAKMFISQAREIGKTFSRTT
jgi:DNA-binding transcriptional LysR family regulator